MNATVMKFGGSCLTDAGDIKKVASIVSGEKRCVTVVSAVSGVTDSILRMLSRNMSERRIVNFVSRLTYQHLQLLRYVCSSEVSLRYGEEIRQSMRSLERLLFGALYTGEITPRTRSLMLSFGERLSARLVAAALQEAGVHAAVFETDREGIITDDDYENASADLKATRRSLGRRLRRALERGEYPVVTGFFGSNPEGRVTLLGRNGTDYSASVVAHAVNAERLIIWKDVDGFLTADPSMVAASKLIPEISYDEASELAYFGASILHPRAVEPAKLARIPIMIKNMAHPEKEGTVISSSRRKGAVKSVSFMEGLGIVRVYMSGGGSRAGSLSSLSGLIGRSGVNIISATTSQTCISFLLRREDMDAAAASVAPLVPKSVDRVEREYGVALVCIVGHGLGDTKGVAASVFSSISSRGINVDMISAGASLAAFHFTVRQKDLRTAVEAVHRVFFG